MHGIELVIALLLASTVLAAVARAIKVHYAIVLVLGGLVVGLVSGTSAPQVDPDVVLFVLLPPLIYAAAFGSSTQDLRAHAGAIGLLAVGLVLLTMGAVAVVAHQVADIAWGPALVLGAILGPTDERITGPRGISSAVTVLKHPVWCSPCRLRECPIGHRCMRGVSVDAVAGAVRQML